MSSSMSISQNPESRIPNSGQKGSHPHSSRWEGSRPPRGNRRGDPSSRDSEFGIPDSICSRRDFLSRAGGGLGALALSSLLNAQEHFAPKAKSVIWLFMEGGPSGFD